MRVFSVGFTAVLLASGACALTPAEPMCELLAKSGLVPVCDETPEFSWSFKDGLAADGQTAYQVQVATDTSYLRKNDPNLWDSGQVKSEQSLYVSYAGLALPTSSEVCWRVRVWDRKGNPGPWSQTVSFMTAGKLGSDTALRYPLEQSQVRPVRVVTNDAGHAFVDFGKAAFGWVELVPPREAFRGGPYVLHIGEKAIGCGVDAKPGGTIRYAKVSGALTSPNVYRVPLKVDARNTSGAAVRLPPDFGVVMPFRYVEVEDCPFPVTADTIRQIAVHYPFDMDESVFVSSDGVLDRLYKFCKYSIKATSFAGVYVDGDRERIPYEADAYINQLCHYCTDREFTLARYSHEYLMDKPTWPTEWKQHSVMMAWTDWMYTGNTESLVRCYGALKEKKTLEKCARESDGLLVTGGPSAPMESGLRDITDWPVGERDGFDFKPVNAVVNAFYCLNLRQMADMAGALGKADEAAAYRAKAERTTAAFQKVFFDAERGRYVDGEGATHASLHANMLPLAFGLVPEEERGRVAAFVRSRGMSCSVYGAQYLLEALFEAGMDDAALDLMSRDDRRGWVNMMKSGSTVTLEAWDILYKPNLDWNHAWGAAPANILPRFVMGVRPLEAGFGKVLVRPQVGSLEGVQGTVPTVRGPVTVGVRQKQGCAYSVTLEIPVNTRARVELPLLPASGEKWMLDGRKAKAERSGDRWVLDDVPSGKHVVAWQSKEASCASSDAKGSRGTSIAGWFSWLPFF